MKNYLVHIKKFPLKKTFLTWYPVVRFTNNEKKEMRPAVMVATVDANFTRVCTH